MENTGLDLQSWNSVGDWEFVLVQGPQFGLLALGNWLVTLSFWCWRFLALFAALWESPVHPAHLSPQPSSAVSQHLHASRLPVKLPMRSSPMPPSCSHSFWKELFRLKTLLWSALVWMFLKPLWANKWASKVWLVLWGKPECSSRAGVMASCSEVRFAIARK